MGNYLFFAVRALATVVIAASLWPWIADGYDALLVKAGGVAFPEGVEARAADGRIYLDLEGGAPRADLSIHGFTLHFGLILALALVVSTPSMSPVKILAWAGGAVVLFFVAHAIGLSMFLWGLWVAWRGGEGIVTAGSMMTAFAIFWGLLPAMVGGAWCYRFWLPALRSARRDPTTAVEGALKGK